MKFKTTLTILAIFLSGILIAGEEEITEVIKMETKWLGYVVFAVDYNGIDPGFYGKNPPPSEMIDDEVEIGLRADGVVVWRKREKKQK